MGANPCRNMGGLMNIDHPYDLKRLLLAYRDGHKSLTQECFLGNEKDYRCPLCQSVDEVFGYDAHENALDELLYELRNRA